ncbi:MAG: universal stress protein [Sphingobacteriaceae bacterium]|jgi:nucleotide-binding universal stress UspA family protein
MAIVIPNFCIALKNALDCNAAMDVAVSLQRYFRSQVTAFTIGGGVSSLPPNYKVEQLASHKELAKHFVQTESDLMILPLSSVSSSAGVVNASDANKIIEHLERLVLTVPCNGQQFNYSKIVVPIDSSFETRQKVPYAIAMAKAFGSALVILGVSNDKSADTEVLINNYIRQVTTNIEENGVRCVSEVRLGGNPTQQVLDFAKEISAGMIVIMTEQETNLTSFFSGKYSQQMVKGSPIPVLSIHPKDLIVSDARL